MLLEFILELLTLSWMSLFVLLPAAAFNRHADTPRPSLSREEILLRTLQEVDQVFEWYQAQIDPHNAQCVGSCYARYSTKRQDSIGAQVRKILEHAIKLQIYVPREFIFFDIATSGRKGRREVLSQLEATLRSKKCRALILFGTNRLFRKSWRTLQFADRVHQSWGIRIVFIAQGIDTNDKKWELSLHAQAMIDEFVVTMYADNIRAAQEGLFERRLVFGSISYGYGGEVIEGEFSRTGKPRRRLKIDPPTARVVRLIFDLFVKKRQALNEIARILNDDPSVPLPRRCRSGRWTDDTVRRVLTNARYRGFWQYGVTESVYISDGDYVGKVTRAEPLKEAQIEELRIVDDELWFAAAKLIAQNGHGHGGRKSNDGDTESRPRILNGLLYCENHDRPLVVSGAYGRHMVCPVCQCMPARKRPLISWLNRAVALRLLCKELARRILADEELVEQVIGACRHAAEEYHRPNPSSEIRLKLNLEKVKRAIDFTMRSPGESEEDQAHSMRVLRELRTEKAKLEAELRALHAAREAKPKIPNAQEIRKLLEELAKLLTDASRSSDPADRAAVRILIEELIDGPILMSQQGERTRQHGWLRGTFRLRLLNTLARRVSNGLVKCDGGVVEVIIDFKRPLKTDVKADIAWAMHLNKKRNAEIAAVLGCCKPYVTKLLKIGAARHGVQWVDGRSNRLNFPAENRKPALFKRIVDEVMGLFENDVLLGEIAKRLDVHVATISKIIRWWHEERGLPVPNGRTRAGRLRLKANRAAASA
ncbi:MAG: recombinase family protein [Pirellulales bacterium]